MDPRGISSNFCSSKVSWPDMALSVGNMPLQRQQSESPCSVIDHRRARGRASQDSCFEATESYSVILQTNSLILILDQSL